jgi:hypothetical protein
MPRCYKQDSWSNELVVGQSPAGENVSTETVDNIGIRHQATTGEDAAYWEDLVHAVVNYKLFELAIALLLLVAVFNKRNYKLKPRLY